MATTSTIEFLERIPIKQLKNFDIEVGDTVYYARAYPFTGEYEVDEMIVTDITVEYFVCCIENSCSLLFDYKNNYLEYVIHKDKKSAKKIIDKCSQRKCSIKDLVKVGVL